jgi:hypothetical protein
MSTEKPLIPDAEYADLSEPRCPVCREQDLDYGETDYSGKWVSQEVYCEACKSTWYDVYLLQGYENLDIHGKEREAEIKRLHATFTIGTKKERPNA